MKKTSIFLCSPITYNLSFLCKTKSPLGICISPSLSIPEINIESFKYFISCMASPSNPSPSSIVNPTKSTFPFANVSTLLTDGNFINFAISKAASFSGFITKSIPSSSFKH